VGLPGTSAPAALHRAAEERDAGLLVVGSRRNGHSGLLRPGSTAERLMHGAPCPLAIVPGGWTAGGGLRTLGVAYTDTPEGHEALHSAIALARRAEAKLRVLTAVKPHVYGKVAGSGPGTEGSSYDAAGTESEHLTQQILEEAAAEAGGLDVETDVSVQDAADFLIAASQNVDLLICGSRGYGPKRAVLLGGVSRRVATESSCPVIVLARGIEFGLEALVGEEPAADAAVESDDPDAHDRFPYPGGNVVAVLLDDPAVADARERLEQVGFGRDRYDVLHGERDAGRIDVTGEAHGRAGTIMRKLQAVLSDDADHARGYAEHLRAGHYLVGVSVGEDEQAKRRAADALRAADPESLDYYADTYVEDLRADV
jgi:nucleotide-binding universal stress UspA family protein